MQKFTVFTVVLSIVVIVIVTDMVVNNYLPEMTGKDIVSELTAGKFTLPESLDVSKATQTNVLGADETSSEATNSNHLGFDLVEKNAISETETEFEFKTESDPENIPADNPVPRKTDNEIPVTSISSSTSSIDFEDNDFTITTKNIYLRDEQLKSAGFVSAYLEEEQHDGSLYKTIYTDDLYDVAVKKFIIKSDDAMFAKVYIIKTGPSSTTPEVYQVLRIRGSEGLELEINETNEFGDGSFYMNDSRRPQTAFLTVKLGNLIYGFSYPKEYHSQVKNLVKLLEWEK